MELLANRCRKCNSESSLKMRIWDACSSFWWDEIDGSERQRWIKCVSSFAVNCSVGGLTREWWTDSPPHDHYQRLSSSLGKAIDEIIRRLSGKYGCLTLSWFGWMWMGWNDGYVWMFSRRWADQCSMKMNSTSTTFLWTSPLLDAPIIRSIQPVNVTIEQQFAFATLRIDDLNRLGRAMRYDHERRVVTSIFVAASSSNMTEEECAQAFLRCWSQSNDD